ncbi:MAG: hypothetical protein KGZ88_09510 [Methylomicrobium sp.]|nr:hypothetical protein [Methylomicrobium sp.]
MSKKPSNKALEQLDISRKFMEDLLAMTEDELWDFFRAGEIDRLDTNFKSQLILALTTKARSAIALLPAITPGSLRVYRVYKDRKALRTIYKRYAAKYGVTIKPLTGGQHK